MTSNEFISKVKQLIKSDYLEFNRLHNSVRIYTGKTVADLTMTEVKKENFEQYLNDLHSNSN